MGIDYYMCDICGEATPEYSYKNISFSNASDISICKWCFKELINEQNIQPVENYKREKKAEDKTKDDSDDNRDDDSDDSDNEYRDYDGDWKVLKAFDIIHTNKKPIKFKVIK